MRACEIRCDRCRALLSDTEVVELWSLRYVIRGTEPRCKLDLCKPCFGEFRSWLERPQ